MAVMRARWVEVLQKEGGPKARSSHAVAVVGKKAYVFGGEVEPRVPVDNEMHVLNLEDGSWSVARPTGEAPPPRIGVTMAAVGNVVYVFGGRDGAHRELNELYSFHTQTHEWKLLSSGAHGPPHRSYHAMAADEEQIYIFGGCGTGGRLNDLWGYRVAEGRWEALPSPNCVGRGGAGLAVAGRALWVVFGFGGFELSDVHRFDSRTRSWEEVQTAGEKPTARSVFASFVFGKYIICYGGEVDPSAEGHMGAGAFSADVFALDTELLEWRRLEVDPRSAAHPGPRGWAAFCAGNCAAPDGYGMLVYGGNSPSNARLDDILFLLLVVG